MDQFVELFSLLVAELHDVFLYGDLFPGHESAPSMECGAIESEINRRINDVRSSRLLKKENRTRFDSALNSL
jgi:hypothetical protein